MSGGALPARVIRRWTGFLLLASLPLVAMWLARRGAGGAAAPWVFRLLGGAGLLLAVLAGLAALGVGGIVAIRQRSLATLGLALLFGAAGLGLAWVYLQRVSS